MLRALKGLNPASWSASGKRTGIDVALTAVFVALVVIANVILYSVCTIHSLYFWVDDDAVYRIGEGSERYLEKINPDGKDITIHFCMPQDEINKNRAYLRVYETAMQFAEKYEYFHVDNVNIHTDYALVKEWSEKNKTEISSYSVVFTSGEESYVAAMDTFYVYQEKDNAARMEFNGEETVVTVANYVLHGAKSRPTAMMTTGHAEAATFSLYNLLTSAGYNIGDVDLLSEEIPEECSLLVISNPTSDFSKYSTEGSVVQFVSEIDKLEALLARGGTLLVLRSPDKRNSLANLDALLEKHGLITDSDSVVEDVQNGVGTSGQLLLADFASGGDAARIGERVRAHNASRVITGKASPIRFGETAAHTEVFPLILSSDTAVEVKAEERLAEGNYALVAVSRTEYANGSSSHLILSSSADIASYDMMETEGYANEELLYAILEAYDGVTVPIGCNLITLNAYPVENLTLGEANLYLILLMGVLPVTVAALGVVICRRRKYR